MTPPGFSQVTAVSFCVDPPVASSLVYGIISCMKQRILNPNVFVKNENDPAFRAHILRRAKEAEDPKNRLPLSELKKHLAKHNSKIVNA